MENEQTIENSSSAMLNTQVQQSYIRKDSENGFTNQKAEIARLKATHQLKCLTEKLLGDFDENGDYKITEAIMQELIAMPKYIERNTDNALELVAEYKDGTIFKFHSPKPVSLPDGSFYCTLVLDEDVEYGNGYVIDTISTIVGTFSCAKEHKKQFDQLRQKAFSIYKKEEITNAVRRPTEAIDAKLALISALWENIKSKQEDIEQKYYNRRLEILSGIQDGPAFLREFNTLQSSLENFFLKGQVGNRFATLNDLLNIMIDGNFGQTMKQNSMFDQLMYGLDMEYLGAIGQSIAKAMDNKLVRTATQTLNAALAKSGSTIQMLNTLATPTQQNVETQITQQYEKMAEEQIKEQGLEQMQQQAEQLGNSKTAEQIKQAIEKQKQTAKQVAEKVAKEKIQQKARQREQERVM